MIALNILRSIKPLLQNVMLQEMAKSTWEKEKNGLNRKGYCFVIRDRACVLGLSNDAITNTHQFQFYLFIHWKDRLYFFMRNYVKGIKCMWIVFDIYWRLQIVPRSLRVNSMCNLWWTLDLPSVYSLPLPYVHRGPAPADLQHHWVP